MKKLFFLLLLAMNATAQSTAPGWLTWTDGPKLPVAVSSAFVGTSGGRADGTVLLVAGGSNFPTPKWEGGQKTYYRDIYAQPNGPAGTWVKAGTLPRPIADGAAIETPDGLLCLGGTDGQTVFADVFLLRWDAATKQVRTQTDFPKLPQPLSHLAACRLGNVVYVMGGQQVMNDPVAAYYQLDLSKKSEGWKALPAPPAPPRFGASLVVQHDGDKEQLYLMSGKGVGGAFLRDAYAFAPRTVAESAPADQWKRLADLPRPAFLAPHAAAGPAHVLVFSGSDGHDMDKAATARGLADYQFVTNVLAYHTITNTWTEAAAMPLGLVGSRAVSVGNQLIIPGGEVAPGVRTDRVQVGTLPTVSTKALFGGADYAVLGGYLIVLAGISLFFARRNNSAEDYLLGGQRVPAWAAGISVMATQVSAIGFMTIPAKVYAVNWAYFIGVFTWFVVVPIVAYRFIPLIRRLRVTSVYEYLERRFDGRVRMLAASLFILFQLGRMGLVLYLPALALSAVTPLDTLTCILIIGLLSTVYTVLGGIEGVIWIEVVQTLVLFCGAIVCIVLAINGLDGGINGSSLGTFWEVATRDNKFSFGTWDWDLTTTSLVVLLVGNVFIRLGNLTTDQAVVQRYLTTPDVREAQKTLWTDVATSIPWAIVVYLLGTVLYVYYQQHPAELSPTLRTDSILPHFVSQHAPFGLSGLIIAGIFAASMSSSESHIHSLATILTTDFYARFHTLTPERTYRVARFFTVALGLLSTVLALSLLYLDIRSLLDFFQELTGLFIGSSAGLFALGMGSRRANATGAMIGAVGSMVALGLVKAYTPLNFWLYSAIGFVVCVALGYVASLLLPGRSDTNGLTIWALTREEKPVITIQT